MNLTKLQAAVAQDEDGVPIPIYDPTGEPYAAKDGSPVTWSVTGTQAKGYRKALDTLTRKMSRAIGTSDQVALLRERRLVLATAGSVGWSGWEDDAGEPVPFTPENARAFLETDERVLAQVEYGIERHAAFLAAAQTS